MAKSERARVAIQSVYAKSPIGLSRGTTFREKRESPPSPPEASKTIPRDRYFLGLLKVGEATVLGVPYPCSEAGRVAVDRIEHAVRGHQRRSGMRFECRRVTAGVLVRRLR